MSLAPELQSAISDARAIVRIGYPWWLRPLLFRDVVGITLGRRIWIAPGIGEVEALIRHELVHVEQMGRLGVVRFLWDYVGQYLRNRRRGMSHDQASLAISFEVEALAAERREPI